MVNSTCAILLILLADLINWNSIDPQFRLHFMSHRVRPALPSRLVAGLLYLQQANGLDKRAIYLHRI